MKYSLTMTTEHPIINGHMVYEQNLLPGLAYIDVLYQLAQEGMGLDYRQHCLKRLSIYNPLIVAEDRPVKLEILFDKVTDYWKITVEGTETDAHGNPLPSKQKLYITAELHEETIIFDEQIDTEAMKQAAAQPVDMEMVYAKAGTQGLVHQGMIKAKGNMYPADAGCLIELRIDDAYHDEATEILFHPTLIDGAAMATGFLEGKDDTGNGEELYIPLYYESFSCSEPLQTHCYARVSPTSLRTVNDVRTIDIAFFNTAGKQVAQLNGITAKRIRFKEQINPGFKKETVSAAIQGSLGSEPSQYQLETTATHIESLLRKIFSRRLNQAPSQIDINAGFFELGLESSQLLAIVNDIENSLNVSLSPTLLFENNNIREIVDYLKAKKKENGDSLSAITPVETFTNHARSAQETPDIAVIGLAGRYPGARNIQEFWQNLKAGRDCITEIPKDRWDYNLYFDEDKDKAGKTYCKWGGFLEDVDQFDPLFFNISPREAEIMDPMDRLFLETVWNLLENTGYTQETLHRQYQSRIGVYVGAMYQQYHYYNSDTVKESAISISSYSSIANRVSYFFNLQGPSVAIDTACSSSAIAIHMACESLTKGDCQLAIAGGVNLSIHPNKYLGLSLMQLLGSHPDSRSFGNGDGFLPAEGVGAVLLKPLAKAIRDGDPILAVIKSTATNHGGRTSGFSVPNPNAQARLIEDNFLKSGIDPRTISYVEAAASGTVLGDPIEITGLNKAFQKFTRDQQFCAIGSVKSNIGHAEAASGISQLTKVILQLQHQQLVPSIKAEPLNPGINFNNSPFYLQRELQEWKRPVVRNNGDEREFPRRATVSSFGAGGSNAHLIIEEYIPSQAEPTPIPCSPGSPQSPQSPQIVVFSAKNPDQLAAVIQQILDFIEIEKDIKDVKEISLADLAYTLQVGREAMEFRLAMVGSNKEELIQGMKEYLNNEGETSIPAFTGDQEGDHSKIRSLLSGKAEQAVLQVFLAEQDFEKIALYWTQGGRISWELLHEGQKVRIIPLPTYPFARERYWISEQGEELQPSAFIQPVTDQEQQLAAEPGKPTQESIQDYIVQFLSRELRLPRDQIKVNKNLQNYGVDSIVGMKLMRDFETRFNIKITGREMLEHQTIKSLSAHLALKLEGLNSQDIQDIVAGDSLTAKSQPGELPVNDPEIEALEKFKQGELTLEEIESLLDKGVI
ncbi:MAG TPA: beta-ketoacyl synthase N-terminal-like domain-containing protein [Methylomusa anaerophila]|uniref:Polyketide synthase PksL n=1 Tax=Methylomusa anaerophila TaxID=1930071 RepID=A0A348AQV7_9FIRM|nr:beta-ketoacyl synthase N-terminal-like domain-containing protein [Methylomusa anaerophila]BBB93455.1 polyketide synthase PksL [Methylomusa anaerophila]HML90295.1 beta-ketoacyl synthase N-terminal-like domain-containing protein [Methylomusa anaerophila]